MIERGGVEGHPYSCGPLLFQVVLLWLNNRFICGTLGGREWESPILPLDFILLRLCRKSCNKHIGLCPAQGPLIVSGGNPVSSPKNRFASIDTV